MPSTTSSSWFFRTFRSKVLLASLAVLFIISCYLSRFVHQDWDVVIDWQSHEAPYMDRQNASLAIQTERKHYDEYVAICLAVRDEGPALQEWLMHHYYHLGIKRFYILDDHSDPPMHLFQEDWGIPSEAISFRRIAPDRPGMQNPMYDACHNWFGHLHQWLVYIDADEFLELRPGSHAATLADFLVEFEGYGALAVNWLTHNSNDQLYPPKEGTRKGFTTCIKDHKLDPGVTELGWRINTHFKSIVNTRFYGKCLTPHSFETKDNSITVGEYHDAIPGGPGYAWRTPITYDKIALHHYVLKSVTEYGLKTQRGSAQKNHKDWAFWDLIEGMESEKCTSMTRYDP